MVCLAIAHKTAICRSRRSLTGSAAVIGEHSFNFKFLISKSIVAYVASAACIRTDAPRAFVAVPNTFVVRFADMDEAKHGTGDQSRYTKFARSAVDRQASHQERR